MKLGIDGRIALITGAASGIGKATARLLLEEGVRVAISGKPHGNLDQTVAEFRSLGEIVGVEADVADQKDVDALFANVNKQLGAPDILVNCAGITGETGDFLEVEDSGWLEVFQINLMGAVRTARAAIPAMRAQKWGRVVLIGSEDAIQPYVDDLAYCASKAGVVNLAKGLSKAYGCDNVLVNSVSPAFIATPMTDAMMEKRASENGCTVTEAIEHFLEEERPGMVLKRRGTPEEVAAMIVFLCSEQASFINGANIRVDSGSVMTVGA